MGVDNYTRWHRQHCLRLSKELACNVCTTLNWLDSELDGVEDDAKFEDWHFENCWMKNCKFCETYRNIAQIAEVANKELKAQGHVFEYSEQEFKERGKKRTKVTDMKNKCQADGCDTHFALSYDQYGIYSFMVPSW